MAVLGEGRELPQRFGGLGNVLCSCLGSGPLDACSALGRPPSALQNDYKTLDPSFMESVWWVFKQLFDKGLVYRGFKASGRGGGGGWGSRLHSLLLPPLQQHLHSMDALNAHTHQISAMMSLATLF